MKLTAETITNQLKHNAMTARTKVFIQKICYKRTASVDMTKHGFINDMKHPVNLLLKSLREQLEKVWGKHTIPSPRKKSPVRNKKSTKGYHPKCPKHGIRFAQAKKDDKITKRRRGDMNNHKIKRKIRI